jgi:hypothetical protein
MSQHGPIHPDNTAGNLPLTYAVGIPVPFLRGTADSTGSEVGVGLIKKFPPSNQCDQLRGHQSLAHLSEGERRERRFGLALVPISRLDSN